MKRGGFIPTGDFIALGSKASTLVEKTLYNTNKTKVVTAPKNSHNTKLSSFENKAKEEIYEKFFKAKENNNLDLCQSLILGAIKNLKKTNLPSSSSLALGLNYVQKPDINPLTVVSLLMLAKEYPLMFQQPEITEALCSLLQRENILGSSSNPTLLANVGNSSLSTGTSLSLMNQQTKTRYLHFNQLSIIVCNLLCTSYVDEEDWPELFIKVYLEDSTFDRIWVDNIECKSFIDNILTAFNTRFPSNLNEDIFVPKTPDPIPIFPRYMTMDKQIETFCIGFLMDFMNAIPLMSGQSKHQIPYLLPNLPSTSNQENVSKNFLKTLMRLSCYEKVRDLALSRLEIWLQNPKLVNQAQDLLSTVCYNIGTNYQLLDNGDGVEEEIFKNEISSFLRIRFIKGNKPALLQHYITCFEQLLRSNSFENTKIKIILVHLIHNELSTTKNPNNSYFFNDIFQADPIFATKIIAEEFLNVIKSSNKEDPVRPLKIMLKEIYRAIKTKSNFNHLQFAQTLTDTKINNYGNVETETRMKYLNGIVELLTFNSLLSFHQTIKDNLLQFYQSHLPNNNKNAPKASPSPGHANVELQNDSEETLNEITLLSLKNFKKQLSQLQAIALNWLSSVFDFAPFESLMNNKNEELCNLIVKFNRFLTQSLIKIFGLHEVEVLENLRDINLIYSSSSIESLLNPPNNTNQVLPSLTSNVQNTEKVFVYQFFTRQTPLDLSNLSTFLRTIQTSQKDILTKGAKISNYVAENLNLNKELPEIILNIFYRCAAPMLFVQLANSPISNQKQQQPRHQLITLDPPIFSQSEIFYWATEKSELRSDFFKFQDLLLKLTSVPLNECSNILDTFISLNQNVGGKRLLSKSLTKISVDIVEDKKRSISNLPFISMSGNYWKVCVIITILISADPSSYGFFVWDVEEDNDIKKIIKYYVKRKFKLTFDFNSSRNVNNDRLLKISQVKEWLENVKGKLDIIISYFKTSNVIATPAVGSSVPPATTKKKRETSSTSTKLNEHSFGGEFETKNQMNILMEAEDLLHLTLNFLGRCNDVLKSTTNLINNNKAGEETLLILNFHSNDNNNNSGDVEESDNLNRFLCVGDNWNTLNKTVCFKLDENPVNQMVVEINDMKYKDEIISLMSQENNHEEFNFPNSLRNVSNLLDMCSKFCGCRSPDYLLDLIREDENTQILYEKKDDLQRLSWINELIETNDTKILEVLPVSCLCEYLRSYLNGFKITFNFNITANTEKVDDDEFFIYHEMPDDQFNQETTELNDLFELCKEILIQKLDAIPLPTKDNVKYLSNKKYLHINQIISRFNSLLQSPDYKNFKNTEDFLYFWGIKLCDESYQIRTQCFKILLLVTSYETFINKICLTFGSDSSFLSLLFGSSENFSTDALNIKKTFMEEIYTKIYANNIKTWIDFYYSAQMILSKEKISLNGTIQNPFKSFVYLMGTSFALFEDDFDRIIFYLDFFHKFLNHQPDNECEDSTNLTPDQLIFNDNYGLTKLAITLMVLSDFLNSRYRLIKLCYEHAANSLELNAKGVTLANLLVKLFVDFIKQILKYRIASGNEEVLIDPLALTIQECRQKYVSPILLERIEKIREKTPWMDDKKPLKILQKHFLSTDYSLILPVNVLTANVLVLLATRNVEYSTIENFEDMEHLTQFWFPSFNPISENERIISILPYNSSEIKKAAQEEPLQIIQLIPQPFRMDMLFCHLTHSSFSLTSDDHTKCNSIIDAYFHFLTSHQHNLLTNGDLESFLTYLFQAIVNERLPNYSLNRLLDFLDGFCCGDEIVSRTITKIAKEYILLPCRRNISVRIKEVLVAKIEDKERIQQSHFIKLLGSDQNLSLIQAHEKDDDHMDVDNESTDSKNLIERLSDISETQLLACLRNCKENYVFQTIQEIINVCETSTIIIMESTHFPKINKIISVLNTIFERFIKRKTNLMNKYDLNLLHKYTFSLLTFLSRGMNKNMHEFIVTQLTSLKNKIGKYLKIVEKFGNFVDNNLKVCKEIIDTFLFMDPKSPEIIDENYSSITNDGQLLLTHGDQSENELIRQFKELLLSALLPDDKKDFEDAINAHTLKIYNLALTAFVEETSTSCTTRASDNNLTPKFRLYLDWCLNLNFYFGAPSSSNTQKEENKFLHLYMKLFFGNSGSVINGEWRNMGICWLLHEADWEIIGLIMKKLLANSPFSLPFSEGIDATLALNFFSTCLDLPRIWQGCDSRSKLKYPHFLLNFNSNEEFEIILDYMLYECIASFATPQCTFIILSERIDTIIYPCLRYNNHKFKLTFVQWVSKHLEEGLRTEKEDSFIKCYLLCRIGFEVYLRFPDISYAFNRPSIGGRINHFNTYIKFYPCIKSHPISSPLKSASSSFEQRLQTRQPNLFHADILISRTLKDGLESNLMLLSKEGDDPTFIGPDGQPLISLTPSNTLVGLDWARIDSNRCRDFLLTIARNHPFLVMRHINLMIKLLQGRTHLLYSVFAHKGHFALFKILIHVVFTLQPFILLKGAVGEGQLQSLLDTFLQMINSYAQFRFKMAFYVKRILTIVANYAKIDPDSGNDYIEGKIEIIKNLETHYPDIFDSPFWKSRLMILDKEVVVKLSSGKCCESSTKPLNFLDLIPIHKNLQYVNYIHIPIKNANVSRKRQIFMRKLRNYTRVFINKSLIHNSPKIQDLSSIDEFYTFLKEFQGFIQTYPDIVEPFMSYVPNLCNSFNNTSLAGQNILEIILNIMMCGWKHMSQISLQIFYDFYVALIKTHHFNAPQCEEKACINTFTFHTNATLIRKAFQMLPDITLIFPSHWKELLTVAFLADISNSLLAIDLVIKAIKSQRN